MSEIKMPNRNKLLVGLDVASGVGVLVASIALVWSLWFNQRPISYAGPGGGLPRPQSPVEDVAFPELLDIPRFALATAPAKGRLAIVEFSDFQCPFCGRFARETFPQVKRDFIETGEAIYSFRHFPLDSIHPQARQAALMLECAGEAGKYWQMHELLFRSQDDLLSATRHASELKLDPRQFDGCLARGSHTQIETDKELGRRLGVQSTPTIFIGRVEQDGKVRLSKRVKGAMPYDVLKAVIEKSS